MQQLTEMDYSMVQMETKRSHQHIAMVMFYDQSQLKGGKVRFKDILKVFERNLHKSAVFRRRLGGSTMGFDTPYWVEDPDFELEFHLRHIALPNPGDWRQLCILLARVNSRGIDMRRAPWEVHVIEGLDNVQGLPRNSFAVLLKVHHAAVDGVAMAGMLNAIHSLTDEPVPPLVHDDWHGEQDPSPRQVWTQAIRNNLRRPVKLAKTLLKVAPNLFRASEDTVESGERSGGFKTRFNGRVSAHRVIGALIIELERVKSIRRQVEGVTVNDVILCVVGGALRKYMQAIGELPERSLMSSVPISVREESNGEARGNQVGMMRVTLATDLEAPLERLRAINKSARESKEYASARGVRTILEISEGLWPPVIGAGFKLAGLAARVDLPFPQQTIVSNVPGPQVPVYLAGAKLQSLLGLIPVADGMGLGHAVISGGGKISITFVCCREMMPDPQFYQQCLQDAWSELESVIRMQAKPGEFSPPA